MVETEDEVTTNEVVSKQVSWWKRRGVVVSLHILVVLSSATGWVYLNDWKDKQAIQYLEEHGYEIKMKTKEDWYDLRSLVKRYTKIELSERRHVVQILNTDKREKRSVPNADGNGTLVVRVVKLIELVPDAWLAISRFDQLTHLTLAYAGLTDDDMIRISGLKNLERLDLSGNSITDHGVGQLAELKGLQSLQLSQTLITDEGLKRIANMAELTSLSLNDNVLTGSGFKYLAGMTKLRSLACSDNLVVDEYLHYLAGLKLQHLSLGGNPLDGTGLPPLADLETFGLRSMQLSEQGMLKLKGFKNMSILYLTNSQVPVASLDHLINLPKLNHLSVIGTGITREEVAHLASLLPRRCMLVIDKNLYSEEEVKEIFPKSRILRYYKEVYSPVLPYEIRF